MNINLGNKNKINQSVIGKSNTVVFENNNSNDRSHYLKEIGAGIAATVIGGIILAAILSQ